MNYMDNKQNNIKHHTEGDSPKYLIDNKDKKNVIMNLIQDLLNKKHKELINLSTHPLINFQKAFTLAEVLITLGIIGIVAAITIPILATKIKEYTITNRLKETYSILSQAHKLAVSENGSADGWDIGVQDTLDGANKIFEYYKPYLKLARICNRNDNCLGEHYKALFSENFAWQPNSSPFHKPAQLLNGVSIVFWSGGSGCYDENNIKKCGAIYVDINGQSKPNQAGVDYFSFIISEDDIKLYDTNLPNKYGSICKYNNTSNKNGAICTKWVIEKGNLDYLRRDISK